MLTARTALMLTLLLTLSLCCNAIPSSPSECCYEYRNASLPLSKLKGFYRTPLECFYPAVVFETRKRPRICAHPDADWVKKAVEYLEKKERHHAS